MISLINGNYDICFKLLDIQNMEIEPTILIDFIDIDNHMPQETETFLKILQKLIDRGIDVNAKKENEMTALLAAVKQNNLAVVEFLLKNGAKLSKTPDGETCLHFAVNVGNCSIIKVLLYYTTDPILFEEKGKGKTVEDLALELKNQDILEILREKRTLLEGTEYILPVEIWMKTFTLSLLSFQDISSIMLCCRRFYEITSNNVFDKILQDKHSDIYIRTYFQA